MSFQLDLGSRRGSGRWVGLLLVGVLGALVLLWVCRRRSASQAPCAQEELRPGTHALDFSYQDWTPSQTCFVPSPWVFSADQIPKPDHDRLEEWKRAFPLVRPIPYPYFIGLSIPSDCCGGFLRDLYYSSILLSRRFGLDLPSSFWISTCQPNPDVPALFLADHQAPGHGLLRIEGDAIDRLPLLLTYYYRGWVDHLHQWSDETGACYNQIIPREVVTDHLGVQRAALELTHCVQQHHIEGLEVSLEAGQGVRSFELELTDGQGQPHLVVWGSELAGRPGWDVSDLRPEQLGRFYLYLGQERNRSARSSLGQIRQPHLKAARVTVRGSPGATLKVLRVRLFDITRDSVRGHLEHLRTLNLLPICSTNHGSGTSWTQIDDFNFPIKFKEPGSGVEEVIERPPLGATPGTPCYCADLLTAFGILFHNQTGTYDSVPGQKEDRRARPRRPAEMLQPWRRVDGQLMYLTRRWCFFATPEHPDLSLHYEHFENLGGQIIRYLAGSRDFGQHWTIYTHYNYYNAEAFQDTGPERRSRRMSEVRALHPGVEQALQLLSCLKYNLDGQREAHQRVWCCPLSVALRFSQAQRRLARQTRLEGCEVHIEPWQDEITRQTFPDPRWLTQDLHGQTFYVPDASSARVFCGPVEITALKRNPPDCTGRPSVTVVDCETPSIVFDEVPLEEMGGELLKENVRLSYPEASAPRGHRALEVRCLEAGEAAVVWKTPRFENHETDFLHLVYRKSNPESEAVFSWTDAQGREYTMSEGGRDGRQGWEIGRHAEPSNREVVLEYGDMLPPDQGARTIPRGRVAQFRFGLRRARPGDTVVFDRVEFLSARGLRPKAGTGLVVGGRLTGWQDGVAVQALAEGQSWQTTTNHGGWFLFPGIPRDAIVELSCQLDGRTCRPERGRRCQIGRNDLEYHIPTGP